MDYDGIAINVMPSVSQTGEQVDEHHDINSGHLSSRSECAGFDTVGAHARTARS